VALAEETMNITGRRYRLFWKVFTSGLDKLALSREQQFCFKLLHDASSPDSTDSPSRREVWGSAAVRYERGKTDASW